MSWANGPLVVSSYTLGTRIGFPERVRVAAEAGFAGVGLRVENYRLARDAGLDDAAMLEILDRHRSSVCEVEYVTGWATDRDAAQQDRERTVFHMARTFGVRHVNAGLLEKLPEAIVTEAFADLCRRAGELVVGLEFMPYSGVPDLSAAWRIVEGAGQPNGALLVDAWHWSRAGSTAADLAPVPGDRIVAVQLCDVLEHPMTPLRAESLGHRLLPGQGYGDVAGTLDALAVREIAPEVVAVEVISDELLARGPEVAARMAYAASRVVLRKVGRR